MKIIDIIIDELNNNLTDEQKESGDRWTKLNTEQYQIIQTDHGVFHNPVGRNAETLQEDVMQAHKRYVV